MRGRERKRRVPNSPLPHCRWMCRTMQPDCQITFEFAAWTGSDRRCEAKVAQSEALKTCVDNAQSPDQDAACLAADEKFVFRPGGTGADDDAGAGTVGLFPRAAGCPAGTRQIRRLDSRMDEPAWVPRVLHFASNETAWMTLRRLPSLAHLFFFVVLP